jgi:putative addiction module component (TIGR02574 family)
VSGQLELLEAEALELRLEERAHLASRLVAGLTQALEIEEPRAAEVERRIAEIEAGRVTAVPAPDALARARARAALE